MSSDVPRPPGTPGGPPPEDGPELSPSEAAELEEALRAVPVPPAPGAFREALGRDFASGKLGQKAPDSGSPAASPVRTGTALIEDLLQKTAPPAPARAEHRAELRRRFVAGDLQPSGVLPAGPVPLRPEAARGSRPNLRLVLGTLAAAAALLVVTQLFTSDGRAWRGLEADGQGPVVVDGRSLEPRDLSQLGPAFAEAQRFESGENALDLAWGEDLVLHIRPGTELERMPEDDEGGLRLALRQGEVYLKSREDYDGPAVRIETDELVMRMTGTTVGVLHSDSHSCVCVAHGEVEVLDRREGWKTTRCAEANSHVAQTDGVRMSASFPDDLDNASQHLLDLLSFAERPEQLGF